MMKMPRISTADFVEEKMGKSNYYSEEDCFSKLSDDILALIISCSTMKDAARTSVLSHRWEKLWTFTRGSLEFDASSSFDDLRSGKKSLGLERFRFKNWVDQVLISHKNSYVDEFIVRFDLDITFTDSIDTWIDFAIQKGVQRLELDLSHIWCDSSDIWCASSNPTQLAYSIPYQKLLLWFNSFKNRLPSRPLPLDFTAAAICLPLTSLTLKHVDVTGDVVEQFLRYSPLLKYLCISASKTLTNLRIAGPSLKLEHLEISQYCMDTLEISAVNLLSFAFAGNVLKPTPWSVPKLSTLSVGGSFVSTFIGLNRLYYKFLPQVETLKLDRGEFFSCMPLPVRFGFPEYNNVKQLELTVPTCWNGSLVLLGYPTLIQGFPSLQRLKIQFTWIRRNSSNIWVQNTGLIKVVEVENPYKCLKVVELNGFVGTWTDTEVANYFLQNAASLQKLIIDPRKLILAEGIYRDVVEMEEYFENARQSAKRLKTEVPHGVELVIL